jgi:hypothetical protein
MARHGNANGAAGNGKGQNAACRLVAGELNLVRSIKMIDDPELGPPGFSLNGDRSWN